MVGDGADVAAAEREWDADAGESDVSIRQLAVRRFVTTAGDSRSASNSTGAVVVMCTNTSRDVSDLASALTALGNAMRDRMAGVPVLVIHEDMSEEQVSLLRRAAGGRIADLRFVRIAFALPRSAVRLRSKGVRWVRHWTGNMRASLPGWRTHRHGLRAYAKRKESHPFGYYHMCRFWSGAGYELPALEPFRFVMRIDADSRCSQSLPDVFGEMQRRGAVYAYAREASDAGDFVEGLYLAARAYAERAGTAVLEALMRGLEGHRKFSPMPNCSAAPPAALAPALAFGDQTPLAEDGEPIDVRPCEHELFTGLPTYYTNFEVVDTSFIKRRGAYRAWFEHLDADGGIFAHRWGDAPIRWLGVQMYAPPEAVWQLPKPYCRHP